jgi:hypothetical protein
VKNISLKEKREEKPAQFSAQLRLKNLDIQ